MTTKQWYGAGILFMIFFSVFIFGVVLNGFFQTIGVFFGMAFIGGLVFIAVDLLDDEKEEEKNDVG